MTRAEIIQALLDLRRLADYLEIGVYKGETFFGLRAARKVAVDPGFAFDVKEARKAAKGEFHQVESDEYFGTLISPDDAFHVIFIDGLHTFEQTLRDFTNAIACLKPGGAIVIDDVWPANYEATLPTHEMAIQVRKARNAKDDRRDWTGDVYRLVFHIDSFFQQWSFAAVAESANQLVVWRERRPREAMRQRPIREICNMPYERAVIGRDAYNIRPLAAIVEAVRLSRPGS
jgi:hypothetical protein